MTQFIPTRHKILSILTGKDENMTPEEQKQTIALWCCLLNEHGQHLHMPENDRKMFMVFRDADTALHIAASPTITETQVWENIKEMLGTRHLGNIQRATIKSQIDND